MTETREARGAGISLQALHKEFGVRPALRGIDLQIEPSEFVTIVGRSGSGKSTLLRILSGLDVPSQGSAHIRNAAGSDVSDGVKVVFQEPRLLPWRSVLDNVMIGLPKAEYARGLKVLEQVGLSDRATEYPGVLSGGQRQRVSLARALVHQPSVMLLDEPFGALDALTRVGAQRLVESLWQHHGFTSVLVTHDVEEAVLLGDRVLVFDEGRVLEDVRIDLPRARSREMPEVGRLCARLLDAVLGHTRDNLGTAALSAGAETHPLDGARFISGAATHGA